MSAPFKVDDSRGLTFEYESLPELIYTDSDIFSGRIDGSSYGDRRFVGHFVMKSRAKVVVISKVIVRNRTRSRFARRFLAMIRPSTFHRLRVSRER